MKKNCCRGLFLSAILAVAFPGCSRKTDANAVLEKATRTLASEEPAPERAPAQPSQENQPVAEPKPSQQMSQAMASYKAGQLEDAVTRLQRLRAMPTLSPQQRIDLNDAMAAVMTEIHNLADKGDARAIQAVKQYERLQTQRQ
ncbi:MAG: hypothetical protein HY298_18940 [Verrucomicrobia bacterium]|nr:hypothetical protein [Verrucomicrobiota bacterium]